MKFFMPKKSKISNFELMNCYIPQKKAESMYNKDSTRKSNISYKKLKFFRFFHFSPKARGPLKIFDDQFSEIFKKKSKNGFFRTTQILKGTKSGILVRLSLSRQMDELPPMWNRVNNSVIIFLL